LGSRMKYLTTIQEVDGVLRMEVLERHEDGPTVVIALFSCLLSTPSVRPVLNILLGALGGGAVLKPRRTQ
jgi:hypothetical protein